MIAESEALELCQSPVELSGGLSKLGRQLARFWALRHPSRTRSDRPAPRAHSEVRSRMMAARSPQASPLRRVRGSRKNDGALVLLRSVSAILLQVRSAGSLAILGPSSNATSSRWRVCTIRITPTPENVGMLTRQHLLVAAVTVFFVSCADSGTSVTAPVISAASLQSEQGALKDEYVVLFKRGSGDTRGLARELATAGRGVLLGTFEGELAGFGVRIPAPAVERIRRNPNVLSVSPNLEYSAGHHATTQSAACQ